MYSHKEEFTALQNTTRNLNKILYIPNAKEVISVVLQLYSGWGEVFEFVRQNFW